MCVCQERERETEREMCPYLRNKKLNINLLYFLLLFTLDLYLILFPFFNSFV